MPEDNYLDILQQSLKKKLEVLERIRVKNELQKVLFLDENLEPEALEKNLNEKAALVEELEQLDEGFENIYERVRDTLKANRKGYQEQIQNLQELIRQITAESSSIQAEEQRNYKLAEKKYASVKKQVREVKASHKAVSRYYRSMTQSSYMDPQFLDNKN